MPIFKIQHITRYKYDSPVTESVNQIRLFPYSTVDQEILQHEWNISNYPELQIFSDYWNNRTGIFSLNEPHDELTIESRLIVRTTGSPDHFINVNSGWSVLHEEVKDKLELLELTAADAVQSQDVIDDIVRQIYQPWKSIATTVHDCSQFIYTHFQYIKGITDIETTVDEILSHRGGVCQDFAHLMLHVLRTLKIPSRYVSGYVCPSKTGMRGEGATHAWVEAWIPQHGWAGIDPTNDVWVTNKHVKLAVGRNFSDCSPVKGIFKGPARQKLSVMVTVGYEDGHIFEEINNVNLVTEQQLRREEEEQRQAQQ